MLFRNRSWYDTAKAERLFEWAKRFVFKDREPDPQFEAYLMNAAAGRAGRGTAWAKPLHMIVRIGRNNVYPLTWQLPAKYGHYRHVLHSNEELIVGVAAHEMTHLYHFTHGEEELPEAVQVHIHKIDPFRWRRVRLMGTRHIGSGLGLEAFHHQRPPTYLDLRRAKADELDTTRMEGLAVSAWIAEHGPAGRGPFVQAYAPDPEARIQIRLPWYRSDLAREIAGILESPSWELSTNIRSAGSWHGSPMQEFQIIGHMKRPASPAFRARARTAMRLVQQYRHLAGIEEVKKTLPSAVTGIRPAPGENPCRSKSGLAKTWPSYVWYYDEATERFATRLYHPRKDSPPEQYVYHPHLGAFAIGERHAELLHQTLMEHLEDLAKNTKHSLMESDWVFAGIWQINELYLYGNPARLLEGFDAFAIPRRIYNTIVLDEERSIIHLNPDDDARAELIQAIKQMQRSTPASPAPSMPKKNPHIHLPTQDLRFWMTPADKVYVWYDGTEHGEYAETVLEEEDPHEEYLVRHGWLRGGYDRHVGEVYLMYKGSKAEFWDKARKALMYIVNNEGTGDGEFSWILTPRQVAIEVERDSGEGHVLDSTILKLREGEDALDAIKRWKPHGPSTQNPASSPS